MSIIIKQIKNSSFNKTEIIKELFKASVHYGHITKEWNPRMAPYICSEQYGYHIIDMVKTSQLLKLAGNILEKQAIKGEDFLFIGTTSIASTIVAVEAQKANVFYLNSRWLGGSLSNWITFQNRIQKLNELEIAEFSGKLDRLPRKEMNKKKKQLKKLRRVFGGMRKMTKLPNIVILVTPLKDFWVLNECISIGIPVISLVDTNWDPTFVPYPIPANDDSFFSIRCILSNLANRIIKGYKVYNSSSYSANI